MSKARYTVWADSESTVQCHEDFNDLTEATDYARDFVHQYDGYDADRVIVHVEDNRRDETIDTYENINKCDPEFVRLALLEK